MSMGITPNHGIFIGLPGTRKVPTFLMNSNKRYYYIEQRTLRYKIGNSPHSDSSKTMAYAGPELLIQWSEE